MLWGFGVMGYVLGYVMRLLEVCFEICFGNEFENIPSKHMQICYGEKYVMASVSQNIFFMPITYLHNIPLCYGGMF